MHKAASKSVAVTKKKRKNSVRPTNQGHLPINVSPVTGFIDEPVIRWDVSVVEDTFVNHCK